MPLPMGTLRKKGIVDLSSREEKMIIVDLKKQDLMDVRRHKMRYFLKFRRSELYGVISSQRLYKEIDMAKGVG